MGINKFLLAAVLTMVSTPLFSSQSVADNIQSFGTATFAELKAEFADQPFVVSLWSVDCLPCRVELEMLGELKKEDPSFPLLLISTDSIENREEAVYILEEYELETIESWMFADAFIERLRFSIDPAWHGELPRSYFYTADHTFTAHSGILTREKLMEFFPMEATGD
ncbi:MAG: hypothetical protein Q8L60_16970 [Gammaproteobacteria bacterium]|nr:hypothetical protein [Gammaproteobacteria bacterium]MDP2141537.1 hypothetical protein [Gammaproteobacteria bacterium]MDP2346918.1 hypothetical protein [Gammaproteobacteria bacterium]